MPFALVDANESGPRFGKPGEHSPEFLSWHPTLGAAKCESCRC
jgi:hypothetical protein